MRGRATTQPHLILVTDFYPPDPVGRADKMMSHVTHWMRRGGRATVVAPLRYPGSYEASSDTLTVIRVPFPMLPVPRHRGSGGAVPGAKRPHSYLRWSISAYSAIAASGDVGPSSALMTVSNPVSLHLVGLAAKKRLGVPWIAELRDPWGDDPMVTRNFESVHAWARGHMLAAADVVITYATARGRNGPMTLKHSNAQPIVLELPWFGADESKFYTSQREDPPRLLLYSGQWYPPTITPAKLLEVLSMVHAAAPAMQFTLMVVGPWPESARQLSERMDISDHVVAYGSLSPAEADACQRRADAGIMIIPPELARSGGLPSKFWDYVAASLPIIALAPIDSLAAGLIDKYHLGITIDDMGASATTQQLIRILRHGFESPGGRLRLPDEMLRTTIEDLLFGELEAAIASRETR
jgi:hypothetical protein